MKGTRAIEFSWPNSPNLSQHKTLYSATNLKKKKKKKNKEQRKRETETDKESKKKEREEREKKKSTRDNTTMNYIGGSNTQTKLCGYWRYNEKFISGEKKRKKKNSTGEIKQENSIDVF